MGWDCRESLLTSFSLQFYFHFLKVNVLLSRKRCHDFLCCVFSNVSSDFLHGHICSTFLAAVRSWAEPYLVNNLGLLPLSTASPWRGCPHIGSYSIWKYSMIPIKSKWPSRQSWGRNAKMFVPPSIYPPPIYPGSFPWYLFQVLSVNLPLILPSVNVPR